MDTLLVPTSPSIITIPATAVCRIRSGIIPAIASAIAKIANDRNDHTDTVQQLQTTRMTATSPKGDCSSVSFHADFGFAPTEMIEWA